MRNRIPSVTVALSVNELSTSGEVRTCGPWKVGGARVSAILRNYKKLFLVTFSSFCFFFFVFFALVSFVDPLCFRLSGCLEVDFNVCFVFLVGSGVSCFGCGSVFSNLFVPSSGRLLHVSKGVRSSYKLAMITCYEYRKRHNWK